MPQYHIDIFVYDKDRIIFCLFSPSNSSMTGAILQCKDELNARVPFSNVLVLNLERELVERKASLSAPPFKRYYWPF